jgi:hypothetical protein
MESGPPKADQPKRERRWFQPRLRTLMIVVTLLAVPCAYVGWQAKIVRERRAMRDSILDAGGYITDLWFIPRLPPPSWLRRILGDETVEILVVPDETDEQTIAEIRRLFPDTKIAKRNKGPIMPGKKVIVFLDEPSEDRQVVKESAAQIVGPAPLLPAALEGAAMTRGAAPQPPAPR